MGPPQPELQQRYSPQQYTPLTATVSQVVRKVQHERFLRSPSQMKSDPARRDDTKYCEFHKDYGHRTDDCIQLKKEIEYLIRHGHLSRYVAPEGAGASPTTTTSSASPSSAFATLRRNPCNLRRVCRRL